MLEKIRRNPRLDYLALYLWAFGLYGYVIACPGPTIPFLAQKYNQPQTSFAFMFYCRSIGFIIGGLITQTISHLFYYHTMMKISMTGTAVSFAIFPFIYSMFWQGTVMLVASIFCSVFQIIAIMCFYEAFKQNEEQYWLQLSMIPFGICALSCPLLTSVVGEKSFLIIGIFFGISSLGFHFLKTPQVIVHRHLLSSLAQTKKSKKLINLKVEFGMALMIFIYFAEETGFGGWVSSYAVMLQIYSKEGAAILVSLFWISITVSRFLMTLKKGSNSQKILFIMKMQAVSFTISILALILGFKQASAILGCILVGFSYSSTYALIISLPLEYNQTLQPTHTAHITIAGTLGQGILTTLQGKSMHILGPQAFLPYLFVLGIIKYFIFMRTRKQLQQKQQPPYQEKEMEKMQTYSV